ncbi:MAG TPA: glycosyltransferase family 1 protein [Magnetospirillaceae bacterium]|nr:glycosyltransferase family 1 protein [Magnetospirillaceae bacterium]
MRLALVTDAWHPQQNGVVRVLDSVLRLLEADGHEIEVISPEQFTTIPCPTYPEIPLAVLPGKLLADKLERIAPDAIHLATEGPLGWSARSWCLRNKFPFTTAYHSKFPEYLQKRTGLPLFIPYAGMRHFHAPSAGVLVPSPNVYTELQDWKFRGLKLWSHGVDQSAFKPGPKTAFEGLPRPIFLNVGRVTVDKNLEAFLDLDLPGTKVVVGSGPQRAALIAKYPAARFVAVSGDEALAACYNGADVFVFPSKTDTFGLVMLEALACGVPVAAYPVTGPKDVIGDSSAGVLSEDLRQAALDALSIDPAICIKRATEFPWSTVKDQFVANLASQAGTNQ